MSDLIQARLRKSTESDLISLSRLSHSIYLSSARATFYTKHTFKCFAAA